MNAKRSTKPALRNALGLGVLGCVLIAAGCNWEMRNDSRLKPLEGSPVFADGRSSRPLVPGVVAQHDKAILPSALTTGMGDDGEPVAEIPIKVTAEVLERGRNRFNIYCSVCHGEDGYGNGPIVRRGFPQPPSYHIDRLRRAPVGHMFDVISNGYGVMYSYNDRIPKVEDRWAIVAYVRALQLSQHANVSELPAETQSKIQQGK